MKGQIKAGNLIIAFIVLSFVLLGLFNLYAGFLVDNDVNPDSSIQTAVNELYGNATNEGSNAQVDSEDTSSQTASDDGISLFARGAKVLKSVQNTGIIALNSIDILEDGTKETQLPTEFYVTIGLILTLIFVFAVAGAYWKFDLIG